MTHTPGPWAITKGAYGALNVGPASLAHPGKDATYYALERGRDLLAQRAADAALIAAAPDLLRIVFDLIAVLERDTSTGECRFCGRDNEGFSCSPCAEDCLYEEARAAIAKATAGKEP